MVESPTEDAVLAALRSRPDIFATRILGQHLYPYQRDILLALAEPGARVAVRSCNSIGKDFVGACAVLHFGAIYPDLRGVTTGPTGDTVRDIQWGREIHRLWAARRLELPGRMLDQEWDISPQRNIRGLSTNSAEAFQGRHAERVLVIVTEASAEEITPDIWLAIDRVISSGVAHVLLLGNPLRASGRFHDVFTVESHLWRTMHVSAFDTPNLRACAELDGFSGLSYANWREWEPQHGLDRCPTVEPGLVSHAWVEEMRERYGEDKDAWRVSVLGDFPVGAGDMIAPLEWLEAACTRQVSASGARIVGGCDVAREGFDLSALVLMQDAKVLVVEEWDEHDLMATVGRLVRWYRAYPGLVLAVDDTGLGGGVTDRLAELVREGEIGGHLLPVNFGQAADERADFVDKKSEMWWRVHEALDPNGPTRLALPGTHPLIPRIVSQLSAARYKVIDSNGRLWVGKRGEEHRGDKATRGVESPDLGDALALALEAWAQFYGGRHRRERVIHRDSFLGAR